MGHSAGAYNAAMVALDARWLDPYAFTPQHLRGWIGLAGPYNFLPIRPEAVKPIFTYPDTPFDTQPLAHASHTAPPTFLAIATDDTVVHSQVNSGQLAEKLRAANVVVVERSYATVTHSTLIGAFARPLRGLAPVLDDVEKFVRNY